MSGKKFPDVLMQEIRCLLALDARNHIMTVKGAMKTDGQLRMLEKIYSVLSAFINVVAANTINPFLRQAVSFQQHIVECTASQPNSVGCLGTIKSYSSLQHSPPSL